MIYLDNSATTRQFDEVSDLVYKIEKDSFGNPSSLHSMGFEASNLLYDARKQLENQFPQGGKVVFTACGTESDNMAIFSSVRKMRKRGNTVITSSVEHPAVLECMKRLEDDGFKVIYLPVDVDGYVEPQALKAALSEDVVLVSIMTVNNEVGTIEPVMPCYRIVDSFNKTHGTKIIFHTDAVQAFGKLDLSDVPFELVSVSGHKIHGPKGIGALYMRKGFTIPPHILGGGQEGGYRSGTENVSAIAGFGLAAEMSCDNMYDKMYNMAKVNDYLRRGIMEQLPDVVLNGYVEQGFSLEDYGKRCPSVLNLSFMGTRGEVLLHTLEQDGIFVSTGSACHSNKTGDSHVLKAMSLNHKEIEGAIRFSLSEFNTFAEMDYVIEKVKEAVTRFRRLGSFR